jgi:hypothetical protein
MSTSAAPPSFLRAHQTCLWCGAEYCHVCAPGPAHVPLLCPDCRAQARRRRTALLAQLEELERWTGQQTLAEEEADEQTC